MSETDRKIELLARAASGVAVGAALGSSLGLIAGSAVGSLLFPGVGTLIGAASGAFLTSFFTKKKASFPPKNVVKEHQNSQSKYSDSDKKLTTIIESIAANNETLKMDIISILEARIPSSREEELKEIFIKMHLFANSSSLHNEQKVELSYYISTMCKDFERRDMESVQYFSTRIASIAQNIPGILDTHKLLELYIGEQVNKESGN